MLVLIIIVSKYKPPDHLTSSFALFWIWDISLEDINLSCCYIKQKQEPGSPRFLVGFVARSLVFCVVCCRSVFVILTFFFCRCIHYFLCFDSRLMITLLGIFEYVIWFFSHLKISVVQKFICLNYIKLCCYVPLVIWPTKNKR